MVHQLVKIIFLFNSIHKNINLYVIKLIINFSVTTSHQQFFLQITHTILNFLTVLMIQHVRRLGPEITVPSTHTDNLT